MRKSLISKTNKAHTRSRYRSKSLQRKLPLQLVWRRDIGGEYVSDVILADLDRDTHPEILTLGVSFGGGGQVHLTLLNPDGTLKWTVDRPRPTGDYPLSFAVGDVNGDTIPDIVFALEDNLLVFSGDDGHLLLTIPLSSTGSGQGTTTLVVLDVDGDGVNEIAGAVRGIAFVASHTGQLLWTYASGGSFGSMSTFGVVDLDLDGYPELVFPTFRGPLVALGGRTGQAR